MVMNDLKKRILLSTLIALVLLLTLVPHTRTFLFEKHAFQAIDTKATDYVDKSIVNAGTAFVLARGFNAIVSVFQESEVQLEPGGVGVSLALGQALDPVNDLVERFSWVMLASLTSLGIQKFLIEVTPFISVQILLTFALIFYLLGLWLNNPSHFNFTQVAKILLFAAIVVRFAVPAMAYLNHQVYVAFLEDRHGQSVKKLQQTTKVLESYALEEIEEGDIPKTQDSEPEEEKGWFGQTKQTLSNTFNQSKRIFDVKTKFAEVKKHTQDMIDTIIDLIVVFTLNTIVLPLIFLWGIVKLGRLIAIRGFDLSSVRRGEKISISRPDDT